MKTNLLLIGILLAGGIFTANAQNNSATATLTSGGYTAGTAGTESTYYGAEAGIYSTGARNTFVGSGSGGDNLTGSNNAFFGSGSGSFNTTGIKNTFIGDISGTSNTVGSYNTYLGYESGGKAHPSDSNIFIGCTTGWSSKGSNNIYIGNNVGSYINDSNKLMIDVISTPTPLIWGDFQRDQLKLNGKVGVGGVTTFPSTVGGISTSTYKLFVKGGILAEEVRVSTTWADYVFEDGYRLPELNEVECFINENGHLPNVPSAKQVAEEGISVGDMAKVQQEKIEELTLYVIAQDKQLKEEQLKNEKQQKELNELKALVQSLIEKN